MSRSDGCLQRERGKEGERERGRERRRERKEKKSGSEENITYRHPRRVVIMLRAKFFIRITLYIIGQHMIINRHNLKSINPIILSLSTP